MTREMQILQSAVREAGRRALAIASGSIEVQTKPDRTPVTSGDHEVNRVLQAALIGAFPDDGWMSEESPDHAARLDRKRVWVVDPIDGTKYFIDRIPEFAISVALVESGAPVLGVVFNPATDELFSAVRGRGATMNGRPIRVTSGAPVRATVLVAPPALRRGQLDALKSLVALKPMGSIAYTLGLVAAGQADAAINLGRMKEWDVAAGVLLVEEAGGVAFDIRGTAFRFNKTDPVAHGVIAGRPDTAKRYPAWLAALTATRA